MSKETLRAKLAANPDGLTLKLTARQRAVVFRWACSMHGKNDLATIYVAAVSAFHTARFMPMDKAGRAILVAAAKLRELTALTIFDTMEIYRPRRKAKAKSKKRP